MSDLEPLQSWHINGPVKVSFAATLVAIDGDVAVVNAAGVHARIPVEHVRFDEAAQDAADFWDDHDRFEKPRSRCT